MAMLYIFSGLPGSGKTTLSQGLAQRLTAMHLRVDTVEQALRDLCELDVEGEGYRLAYRIAADNLRLGLNVIADSCNTIALTRREWEEVAASNGADFVNVEVTCSDRKEHRRRIESRVSNISGLKLPSWKEVEKREYQPWVGDRIVIDTARRSVEDCLQDLLHKMMERVPNPKL